MKVFHHRKILRTVTVSTMHKWRKWVIIRGRVGSWPFPVSVFISISVWECRPESTMSTGCAFVLCFSDLVKRYLSCVQLATGHQHMPFSNTGKTARISPGCLPLPTFCETHTCFSLELPVSSLLWARDWTDSTRTAMLPCFPRMSSSYLLLMSLQTAEWEITQITLDMLVMLL